MAKGYTEPITQGNSSNIPDDIVDAQNKLQARRKLCLILKPKSPFEHKVHVGDFVQFYSGTGTSTNGENGQIKELYCQLMKEGQTVQKQTRHGKQATVAIEDN